MQNNQDHLRFRRRAIPTAGESQQKNKFGLILTVATTAILLPVMIYGLMHPSQITSTVKQIAHRVALPVKEVHVAVVAARTTPKPSPTPTPTSTATPAGNTALNVAHLAHLKRLHSRALAAARAKKVASVGQTSDIAGSESSTLGDTTSQGATNTQPSKTASVATAMTPAPTPAAVAAAQAPDADATPVYAPDVVVDARFTRQVQPDYPEIAKDQGATGTAVVFATVGPDGKVISAHIDESTGNKLLDQAALEAAKASGFEPPIINGKPATETYRLVYNFEL